MPPANKLLITSIFFLLLNVATSNSWALAEDNEQPINIQSDSAIQQTLSKGEQITYTGHVVMTQGSLLIKADNITILSINKEVNELTAEGKPAHFQQQSDPLKKPMFASANKIEYRLKNETALFLGDATIEQEGSVISGERIIYNINKEQVQASSAKDSGNRVHMVLTPSKTSETGQKPSPTIENK